MFLLIHYYLLIMHSGISVNQQNCKIILHAESKLHEENKTTIIILQRTA